MAAEVTTPTSRRVLGTKSTNSFLSAGRKNVETGKAGLKHPLPSPQHAGTSRTTKYPKTGEKRRREEMQEQDEESEDRQTWGSPPITRAACSPLQGAHLASTLEPSDSSQASALLSQPLSLLSDIEPVSPRADQETVEESTGSNSLTSRNTTSTLQTSFESSQGVSVEEQFEISEEMSQNALDKIHAVRFSQSQQHTSQLVPPIRPSLLAEASQESFGMSNFIEYEKDERGGDDEDVEMAEPGSKRDRLKNIPLASSPGSAAVKAEIENSAGVVDTVEGSKPSMAEVRVFYFSMGHSNHNNRQLKCSARVSNSHCTKYELIKPERHSRVFEYRPDTRNRPLDRECKQHHIDRRLRTFHHYDPHEQ